MLLVVLISLLDDCFLAAPAGLKLSCVRLVVWMGAGRYGEGVMIGALGYTGLVVRGGERDVDANESN